MVVDEETEIASNFRIKRYREIRQTLDCKAPDSDEWDEVRDAFKLRIEERFIHPLNLITAHDGDDPLPFRAGFLLLAVDCLLIDTIQSFREGRGSTPEVSPAKSFKTFLRQSNRFVAFKSANLADEFYDYVRNGLLHNGETGGNWKVRIPRPGDTLPLFERNPITKVGILNRQLFHMNIIADFCDLYADLKLTGEFYDEVREKFLRRMDVLCGVSTAAVFYFAYGSLLSATEMSQSVQSAIPVGPAFLPRYKLAFTKHSRTRSGDAANIVNHDAHTVWGFVYRIPDEQVSNLEKREGGYQKRKVRVFLGTGEFPKPLDAITFVSQTPCPDHCGPSTEYLQLVLNGIKERNLPLEWCNFVASRDQHAS